MLNSRQYLGTSALLAALAIASPALAGDPIGVWVNDTGRGAVEIKPCGAGLCGNVVWVKDASDAGGCGRQIIGDAVPVGSNTWDNGWIYSPERKKKYDVELTPLEGDKLRVKGYAGTKFFSKTMIWTRAPADLVRCGTATEAQAKSSTTVAGASSVAKPETKTAETKTAETKTAAAPQQTTAAPAAPQPDQKAKTPPAATPEVAEDKADKGVDVAELSDKLGEFLKKGPDGRCTLNTPWIKVNFDCDKK